MENSLPRPSFDLRSVPEKAVKEGEITKRVENPQIVNMMKRTIAELRESISEYKILKKENASDLDIPKACNIILFGPSGSGKSSLIKTFYQSFHNKPSLPSSLSSHLIIQNLDQNEGTKKLTKVTIKEGKKSLIEAGSKKMIIESSEINFLDTRGQIMMNENELEQLELLIKGKVRNLSQVEQRTYRYAYLLWEFWKKDSQLFEWKILGEGGNRPHMIVFVFDGSLEEVPNGEEETNFYRDIIKNARSKNYFYPQIVLTRVDKVEEKLRKQFSKIKNRESNDFDCEAKLREVIDQKIESVVNKLGIPRSSVHFIENYHDKVISDSEVSIDYYALKLLNETLKQVDVYVLSIQKPKSFQCTIF